MIPAFLLTGSLDLELLMSVLERVSKPMQAGDNSPVCFQIWGMMHDSKTLGSSFSLNNLDIYWFFPLYPHIFSLCILLLVISSTREKGLFPSLPYFPTHTDMKLMSLCHIIVKWNSKLVLCREKKYMLFRNDIYKMSQLTLVLFKSQKMAYLN